MKADPELEQLQQHQAKCLRERDRARFMYSRSNKELLKTYEERKKAQAALDKAKSALTKAKLIWFCHLFFDRREAQQRIEEAEAKYEEARAYQRKVTQMLMRQGINLDLLGRELEYCKASLEVANSRVELHQQQLRAEQGL